MEVLSKETERHLELGLAHDEVALNGNQLFELQQAVQKVLETSDNLKGYYVRKMLSNLENLDPSMLPIVDEHSKIVKANVKLDDAGNPLRTEAGFEFDDDDKKQKYEAETARLFEKTEYIVRLVRMSYNDFDNMPINTAQNSKIFLILKYLVE